MPNILVVDDNPDVRDVLGELLAMEGYPVTTFGSGLAALLRVGAERPGCIVLDLRLEDVSGFDVFRTLKADPEFDRIPVLLISGAYSDRGWIMRHLDTGPIHFLPKPIIHEELLGAVRSLIGTPGSQAA